MKRLAPILSVCVALSSGAIAGGPSASGATSGMQLEGWQSALQPARAEAKKSQKLIFVDLYADWCGWCKELEKQVFSKPEFQAWAAREAVLLRVDTEDGGDGTMLYSRYGNGSLPTSLVLTPDFGVVARIQGFFPAPAFLARLQGDVATWRKLDGEFNSLLTSTDAARLEELAEALHGREDGHRAALLYRRAIEAGNPNPIRRAELWTRTADAHRIAAEYPEATAALDLAQPHLKAAGEAMTARAEFLRSEIAHERGDCAGAKSGLQRFLTSRPKSSLANSAQRLLDYIDSGRSPACA